MRKRRSAISLLVVPVAVFVWFRGWSLYWIGAKKEKLKPAITNQTDNVIFTTLLPELEIEL